MTLRPSDDATCPCGAGPYGTCCGPYHQGGEPDTAERLMRSRYAAFVRGDHLYLQRTLHPAHEDHARPAREFRASIEKHQRRARYRGLRILGSDGPDADGVHRVLFHVAVAISGKDASFVELSSFAHDGAGLRYVGGVLLPASRVPSLEGLDIAAFERLAGG